MSAIEFLLYILLINGSCGESGVCRDNLCLDVLRDRLFLGVMLGGRWRPGILDFIGDPGETAWPFLSCCNEEKKGEKSHTMSHNT